MSKSKFELLDEALLFEMSGTRRLFRALREPADADKAHADFDQALERWLVLHADLESDLSSGSAKFSSVFMAGIDSRMFSARAVWSLRTSLCWALGTRSVPVTVQRSDYRLLGEGDVIIRGLLEMIDPWESTAVLRAMETRVGEALNEFLLRKSPSPGLENLAEIVLMARDYLFRVEYLPHIEDMLEHHRVRARVELFRPAVQQLVDRIYLVARELVIYGPAVQSPHFARHDAEIAELGMSGME